MGYGHGMATPSTPRRRGKPPKGPRRQHTVRMPAEHYEVYVHRAAELGLDLNDYLVASLAEAHGLQVPEYIRPRRTQEELLPMAG